MDKKRRGANYSSRKKQYLLNIIYKYKDVVENKKTDAVSQKEKDAMWAKIAIEFNCQCPSLLERSVEYENQKKIIRKQKADERMEAYRNGGGPPPKRCIDSSDELVLSIMNEKTVHGLRNPFDGDTTEVVINDGVHAGYLYEIDGRSSNTDQDIETNDSQPSQLSTVNTAHSMKPCKFPGPRIQAETCSQNISSSKRKVGITRRRPAVSVKALTTSPLAEKYSTLLDNRIEISNYEKNNLQNSIQFEREEYDLRKEALKLDILIKKSQLNNEEL